MAVNTGRLGFAFIRIRDRLSADSAVSKLHHTEFVPKYRMNVSIGKPIHEHKLFKSEAIKKQARVAEIRSRARRAVNA